MDFDRGVGDGSVIIRNNRALNRRGRSQRNPDTARNRGRYRRLFWKEALRISLKVEDAQRHYMFESNTPARICLAGASTTTKTYFGTGDRCPRDIYDRYFHPF